MGSETITFGEIADMVRQTVQPKDALGMPYIGLEHIEEGALRLNGYGQAEDVTSTKSKFSKGDILFGKLRPYFRKVIRAPFDGVCSTDIWVVRAKDGIEQGYLFYWMASQDFVDFATQGSEGTKMPRAKWEYVCRYEQALLPYGDQRAISHILGSLDDKIELNRRMNETLEAMARAIFKSWFVDFGPIPGHGPHKEWQDSPLGRIPKGWRVGCVDDEFDLTMGQSPSGKTYNEAGKGMPFYQGRTDFGFRFPTRRVYCTAPTRLAKADDTLISVRAPVGDINMASEDCVIGRGVAAARHKTRSRSYTYYFMHSLEEVFTRFEAEGTVFGSIGKKDFHAVPCVKPSRDVIKTFEHNVSALDSRIEGNERESRTLAAIRDALLPKLLSSEMRVKDAERFIGRCV